MNKDFVTVGELVEMLKAYNQNDKVVVYNPIEDESFGIAYVQMDDISEPNEVMIVAVA